MDNQNQVREISERLKGLRKIIGISKEEMAKVTGVSSEEYIKAEAGERDFSFSFLQKCAKKFGIDITELISGEGPKLTGYEVVRSGEGLNLDRKSEFTYQNLAYSFKNKLAQPYYVTAKYDGEVSDDDIHVSTHAGEEFDYVIKGKLKVKVGNHIEVLNEGDSIYYDSKLEHGMVPVGEDAVFMAMVMGSDREKDEHKHMEMRKLSKNAFDKNVDLVFKKFVDVKENDEGQLEEISFKPTLDFNFGFDVVDYLGTNKPDKLAMLWVSKNKEEKRFTFGDMKRDTSRAANYFKSLGIKKGDKVMLVLKRHYQFWTAIVALHKIGAVVIPATNLLTKKDYEYRFDAARVSTVICTAEDGVTEQVDLAVPNSPTLKNKIIANGDREGWSSFDTEILKFSDVFDRPTGEDTLSKDDMMLMYFTSGTTGYPKIATHDFTYPLGHLVTARYWHNVQQDGIHFTISDTGWGKAVWGKLYGQWLSEAAVFTYDFDRFKADDILPMFEKYKITTFCAPPTMYRFFIQEDISKYDLSSLVHCTIAGEALNPEVFNKFYECTGLKLMEGFGQTETTLAVANLIGMEPKPGSMGKPTPQYNIEIINGEGKVSKDGEVGEIVLRTDNGRPCGMFTEYYLDEEKTKEAWNNDIYHTGDLAWRDENGYFWYVGRTDDLIKSSGYRIGPFEIESVLMEHPSVVECAVTAVPDEIRGQAVKATIVLAKDYVPSDELKAEIQQFVKNLTAPYKYPRVIEFVDELPKTISGKIRRVEIREKN